MTAPFRFARAESPAGAVALVAADPAARFLAGGTNLLDLWKVGVERPSVLVDVARLPGLDGIEPLDGAGLRLGALARNADVADDPRVREGWPLLAQALLAGASPQLRNAATVGGNLLQRTRCYYFTDPAMPCNKRAPGMGCAALDGHQRIHAVLGASPHCIATHPSDMATALAALDAGVRVLGPGGERAVPAAGFHRLPGEHPERDTVLEHGELVLSVDLPAPRFGRHVAYLKVRERSSYAFASVGVAAALRLHDGAVAEARIALGGVAHKPWRAEAAEAGLVGRPPGLEAFRAAAEAALDGAAPLPGNAYKVPLARRAVARALALAAEGRPEFTVSG